MKYLLTGACGFIGAYVLRDLYDRGEDVVCYVRNKNLTILSKIFKPEELEQITFVKGDVRDLANLINTCKTHNIERIIHLATLLADPSRNASEAVKTNILGTINIFDTARILGIKRVIWSSSQTVFGPQNMHPQPLIANDGPFYPLSIYAATKVFLETISKNYRDEYGLEIIGLRYTIVYGYGRSASDNGGYAGQLINRPAYGQKGVVRYGDDAPNWIYVKDASYATMLACDMEFTGRTAYTVAGEVKPMKEVRDIVLSILPDADIELLPGIFGAGWVFDTSITEKELGYKPKYSAAAGVKETIELIQQELAAEN